MPCTQDFVFYHGTQTDPAGTALSLFAEQGALPIGEGEGGQTKGFFVLTSRARAETVASEKLNSQTPLPALITGRVPFDLGHWDLDYELEEPRIRGLLASFKTELCALSGRSLVERDGRCLLKVEGIKPENGLDALHLTYFTQLLGETQAMDLRFFLDDRPRPTRYMVANYGLQKLCDTMAAENPVFRQARADLIAVCAAAPDAALKYIGNAPLPVTTEIYRNGAWAPGPQTRPQGPT
jgi:hypothetical protein